MSQSPSDSAPQLPRVRVSIGIVFSGGTILICRRRATGSLAGFWEFPGGKCEVGETPEAALHRELHEELGITVKITRVLPVIEHTYPAVIVCLQPFLCDLQSGEAQPLAADELRWIEPRSLSLYSFPPANSPLIAMIESL